MPAPSAGAEVLQAFGSIRPRLRVIGLTPARQQAAESPNTFVRDVRSPGNGVVEPFPGGFVPPFVPLGAPLLPGSPPSLRLQRGCGDELPDCGKRLVGFVTPDSMARIREYDETRFGDRFRKLLLIRDGDDRVKFARQD
jgi:hypothetical protein